jgi:hypothetical protein
MGTWKALHHLVLRHPALPSLGLSSWYVCASQGPRPVQELEVLLEVPAAVIISPVLVCIAKYLHSAGPEAWKSKGEARPQQALRPASSWEASHRVVLLEVAEVP